MVSLPGLETLWSIGRAGPGVTCVDIPATQSIGPMIAPGGEGAGVPGWRVSSGSEGGKGYVFFSFQFFFLSTT